MLGNAKGIRVVTFAVVMLFAMQFVSGCFTQETSLSKKGQVNSNINITNYDFSGEKNIVTFKEIPKKIFVCGNNAFDTLLAFGLKDSVATVVVNSLADKSFYQEQLPHSSVYEFSLAQEAVILLKPDFILAQRRFFDSKVLGDTTFWQGNGVPAYIQDASGPIPSLGKFPPCKVESEKNFIKNMGEIFHKEKLASKFNAEIDAELAMPNKLSKQKPKVLVVEFLGENIEIFGKKLLSGDIVTKLGGEIIDFGHPFVSMEDLIQVQADVIFVVYHGAAAEEKVALEKMQKEIFGKIEAVQKGKVYPLRYNSIVATGIHTVETIRLLKSGMYDTQGE